MGPDIKARHPPTHNINYSQYLILYQITGVLNIRGVGVGGLMFKWRGLAGITTKKSLSLVWISHRSNPDVTTLCTHHAAGVHRLRNHHGATHLSTTRQLERVCFSPGRRPSTCSGMSRGCALQRSYLHVAGPLRFNRCWIVAGKSRVVQFANFQASKHSSGHCKRRRLCTGSSISQRTDGFHPARKSSAKHPI